MANLGTDYENAVIAVDPNALFDHAKNLNTYANEVAQSVKRITDTLFNLQLGWAGRSADEVQDFTNRWNQVMTELFGTQDDPNSGALNAMADGAQAACVSYDATEDALVSMFNQFVSDLVASGSGGASGPNADASNSTKTAIIETW